MTTHVKICGITTRQDALFAAQAGADFLGYIFFRPSKRFVEPESVANIVAEVRAKFPNVRHVGVFVDEEAEQVLPVWEQAQLDYVQLHGHESSEYCDGLAANGIQIIKTISIGEMGSSADPAAFKTPFILCDTHDDNLKGGTGRQFDLRSLPASINHDRMFIAGGLNPDNVAEMLCKVQPFALDVSTGVEISPGIKSHEKIKSFIENVRNAMPFHTSERS